MKVKRGEIDETFDEEMDDSIDDDEDFLEELDLDD